MMNSFGYRTSWDCWSEQVKTELNIYISEVVRSLVYVCFLFPIKIVFFFNLENVFQMKCCLLFLIVQFYKYIYWNIINNFPSQLDVTLMKERMKQWWKGVWNFGSWYLLWGNVRHSQTSQCNRCIEIKSDFLVFSCTGSWSDLHVSTRDSGTNISS